MTGGRFDGEIAPFGPAAPASGWGSVPLTFGQSRWFRFDLAETADTFSFLTTWNRDVRFGFSQVLAPNLSLTMYRDIDGSLTPMRGEAGAAFYSAVTWPVMPPSTMWSICISKIWLRGPIGSRCPVSIPLPPSPRRGLLRWLGCILSPLPNFDPADINQDGAVDFQDLLLLLGDFGGAGGPSDVNGDGAVDFQDLVALLAAWS